MNERELNDLLNEMLQTVQRVIASGEVLSDEYQALIAENLTYLVNRIEEIRQPPPEEPPEEPPGHGPGPQYPIPNDVQLLWFLSGQQEQAFISYLRTFPTQETRDLLNDPNRLSYMIDRLNHMMPPGEQPVQDGIPHADLNSSNVWGANYDTKTGKMRVRFQGGSIYEYDGIPANIYRAFIKGNAAARTNGHNQYGRWWRGKNPSIGSALHQYIRNGGYNYRRIR